MEKNQDRQKCIDSLFKQGGSLVFNRSKHKEIFRKLMRWQLTTKTGCAIGRLKFLACSRHFHLKTSKLKKLASDSQWAVLPENR